MRFWNSQSYLCNDLHLNAGDASGSALLPASHSASPVFTHNTKKCLHYTLNMLHQIPHTTHWLHTPNTLNVTNLSTLKPRCLYHCLTVTAAVILSLTSLPQLPPVPQQPNHMFCHIILWLVGVVPFSTNRNMFFCLQTLPACRHFHEKPVFTVSSCNKHTANMMIMLVKKRGGHYLS